MLEGVGGWDQLHVMLWGGDRAFFVMHRNGVRGRYKSPACRPGMVIDLVLVNGFKINVGEPDSYV